MNFISKYYLLKFQEILKVLVKNTTKKNLDCKEEFGKCKTIIRIDGEQVFVSDAYQWKHPNISEFELHAGNKYNEEGLKASIKNVEITSYE